MSNNENIVHGSFKIMSMQLTVKNIMQHLEFYLKFYQKLKVRSVAMFCFVLYLSFAWLELTPNKNILANL